MTVRFFLQYAKFKAGRLYQLNRPPPEPQWKEHDIQRIMYKIQAKVHTSMNFHLSSLFLEVLIESF